MIVINWPNETIIEFIKKICEHISKDEFFYLEKNGFFEVSKAGDIRRSILEYLDGDHINSKNLKKINTPSRDYIEKNCQIFELNPKLPSENAKKIDYDFMIDGKKSDLTMIFRVYYKNGLYNIKIYDALTL